MSVLEDDVYRAEVGELFANFRDALVAIRPIATRAMMDSNDDTMQRGWEDLAEAIFNAFVRGPIDSDRSMSLTEFPLARYDIDYDDYAKLSWLTTQPASPHQDVVVRFLSQRSPFDSVQLADIDPSTLRRHRIQTVPFSAATLVFFRRLESGDAMIVNQIEAVE